MAHDVLGGRARLRPQDRVRDGVQAGTRVVQGFLLGSFLEERADDAHPEVRDHGDHVLLVPPFIMTEAQLDEVVEKLCLAVDKLAGVEASRQPRWMVSIPRDGRFR